MRIMAGRAIGLFYRIPLVQLLKGLLIRFMALQAERGRGVIQELGVLAGSMRTVAIEAIFLDRRVAEFVCFNSFSKVLVAFRAQFAALFQQIELIIGGVRVMA